MQFTKFIHALSHSGDSDKNRLEIHIPISPTKIFFNRVHYLAASLRLNGGRLAESRIITTIGDDSEPFDPDRSLGWSKRYNIEWKWVPRELFRKHSYFATRLYRFRHRFRSDAVLMLDADVIVAAPFDDLIDQVIGEQKLFGVPANKSPVPRPAADFTWEKLFEAAGLSEVPYVMEHTGYGAIEQNPAFAMSPPYFNFGVLPMPSAIARKIGLTILDELEIVSRIENRFKGQMSITLAIVRNNLPWGIASFKYNFVNNELYLQKYRQEFEDLRLMHFLNKSTIHKENIFESIEAVEAALNQEYHNEVDRKFVEILRPVHEVVKSEI